MELIIYYGTSSYYETDPNQHFDWKQDFVKAIWLFKKCKSIFNLCSVEPRVNGNRSIAPKIPGNINF